VAWLSVGQLTGQAGNAVLSLMQLTAVNVNAVRLTSDHNQKSPEVTAEFAPYLLATPQESPSFGSCLQSPFPKTSCVRVSVPRRYGGGSVNPQNKRDLIKIND